MLKFKSMIVCGLITFAVSGTALQSQQFKVAVVEVESVLKELPEAIAADKQIKEIGQKWQDTLLTMRNDLQSKFEQYQKQKSMMPQDKQKSEEENLQKQQMTLLQYQEDKFGQQGELGTLREKLLAPIREKVKQAIEVVAKKEKFQMVVDKLMVLYSESSIDITFTVIDAIKRGTAGK
ncbi:MAG TPA: OmpH family outer membrane protein [Candidatus Kapabacteria bacterium]|nr:OmpH family outer membrane protein [Candidatus Kapabacteria bacterium]